MGRLLAGRAGGTTLRSPDALLGTGRFLYSFCGELNLTGHGEDFMATERDQDDPAPSEEEGGRRAPIPVREMAPPTRPEPVRPREDAPSPAPEVVRDLEVDGQSWQAREGGVTRSGTAPDSGAPLLLVTFQRPGEDGDPERESLTVAKSLDELSDLQLRELFGRSRPFRAVEQPTEEDRGRGGRRIRTAGRPRPQKGR
jgi:hypothetical protein